MGPTVRWSAPDRAITPKRISQIRLNERPPQKDNDPPAVAALPRIQTPALAQSLFALAHGDVLGIARRAHQLPGILDVCLAASPGSAALCPLGGAIITP